MATKILDVRIVTGPEWGSLAMRFRGHKGTIEKVFNKTVSAETKHLQSEMVRHFDSGMQKAGSTRYTGTARKLLVTGRRRLPTASTGRSGLRVNNYTIGYRESFQEETAYYQKPEVYIRALELDQRPKRIANITRIKAWARTRKAFSGIADDDKKLTRVAFSIARGLRSKGHHTGPRPAYFAVIRRNIPAGSVVGFDALREPYRGRWKTAFQRALDEVKNELRS